MVITTTAEYRKQAYQIAKPIISQATIEPRERTLAKSVFGQETPRGKLATYRQTAGFKEVFRQSMRRSFNPSLDHTQLVRELMWSIYSDFALTCIQGQLEPNETVLPPALTSALYRSLHPDTDPVSFPSVLIVQGRGENRRIAGVGAILGKNTDLLRIQGRTRLDKEELPNIFDDRVYLFSVGFPDPNRHQFAEWHYATLPIEIRTFKALVYNDIYLKYRPKGPEQNMPTLAEIQQTVKLRGDRYPQQGLTFGQWPNPS